MKQNYQGGEGDNKITFAVTVGTVGVAYTELSLLKGTTSSGTIASS